MVTLSFSLETLSLLVHKVSLVVTECSVIHGTCSAGPVDDSTSVRAIDWLHFTASSIWNSVELRAWHHDRPVDLSGVAPCICYDFGDDLLAQCFGLSCRGAWLPHVRDVRDIGNIRNIRDIRNIWAHYLDLLSVDDDGTWDAVLGHAVWAAAIWATSIARVRVASSIAWAWVTATIAASVARVVRRVVRVMVVVVRPTAITPAVLPRIVRVWVGTVNIPATALALAPAS